MNTCLTIVRVALSVLAGLAAAIQSANATPDPAYKLIDLSGPQSSYPYAVNDRGHVVGSFLSDAKNSLSGVYIYADGAFTFPSIPAPKTGSIHFTDINNAGVISGYWNPLDAQFPIWHAFTYDAGTTSLTSSPTSASRFSRRVNEVGDVLINYVDGTVLIRPGLTAEIWKAAVVGPNSRLVNIPTSVYTWADAFNDRGDVGGGYIVDFDYPTWQAFIAHADGTTTLVPAEGAVEDINNSGVAVGGYYNVDVRGSFIFEAGTLSALKDHFGRDISGATLNNHRDIVGVALTNPGDVTGVLMSQDKTHLLLDITWGDEGWTKLRPVDISDSGYIIGVGMRNGVQTPFLLAPIPEPSTAALLLCGALIMGGLQRKRMTRDRHLTKPEQ